MVEVTVTFIDKSDGSIDREVVEIPLSVKGSMWCWLSSRPVANRNPYRTLLEHLIVEGMSIFGFDKSVMYLGTENIPQNFDLRLVDQNKELVFHDDTLSDTEIIIEGVAGEQKKRTIPEATEQGKRIGAKKTNEKKPEPQVSGFEEYMEAMRKK